MSLESTLARVGELQALIRLQPPPSAPGAAPGSPGGGPGGASFESVLAQAQGSPQARASSASATLPSSGAPASGPAGAAPPASGDPSSRGSDGLAWPVRAPVTSGFGPRWGRQHAGIDLGAAQGTPVKAAAGGRVKSASVQGGYGNIVVIRHANGTETAYAHLASYGVRAGDTVAAGQVIGRVGSTGHSTGPHLHFEVRVNGRPRDPIDYLPRR